MKINTFIFFLLFYSISTFAQKKQITIFCQVGYNGILYYPKNLEKLLPDSVRSIVMINPRRDYKLKNIDDVLLFMGAYDWRITSFDNRSNLYTLVREITLDQTAWELYLEKLKSIEIKGKQ